MKFDLDTFSEIMATITRNKTRSFLTAFGVFWGVFMLVVLLGGGKGFKELMGQNFKGFAQNSTFVWSQRTSEAYKGFRKGRWWNMNMEDMERLRQLEGIDVVTCMNTRWGDNAVYQDKKCDQISISGLYPEYNLVDERKIMYGRFINNTDIAEKRKVCFIGNRIAEELFGKETDPCGKFIKVGAIYYRIIGVKAKGQSGININGDPEKEVSIPFSTFQTAYNVGNNVGIIMMTMKPGYRVSDRKPYIEELLKRNHNIHPDDKQAVMLLNAEALFGMIDSLFNGINILIWLVGLGTLISGVIGVSNIMMVTVKERTTEIGIRRAIGATPKVIMQQILSESMVLTLVAGMAGISFGVMILGAMDNSMAAQSLPDKFQIDFWMAIGSALMVVLLGLSAGIAPAMRAMSVKPVDAMRDE